MNEIRFTCTDKTKLSDFNLEELRGWVIGRMYQVELKIDYIIIDHFKPKLKDDFRKVVLNSSIISMGGKTKILRNIDDFDKNIIGKIQRASAIRNAFAHLPITEQINVSIKEDEKGNVIESKIEEIISEMEIMKSDGRLKKENTVDKITEFHQIIPEIITYLNNYSQQRL